MNIPIQLKRCRTKSRLTQTDLARSLGIHPMTVSAWERGRQEPSVKQLKTLAQLFSVPITEFFQEPAKV